MECHVKTDPSNARYIFCISSLPYRVVFHKSRLFTHNLQLLLCLTQLSASQTLSLTEDQLKDVVEDKVVVAVLGQVEELREVHGALLLVDLELAGDQDNDAVADGGLGVDGRGDVLDALEGEVLGVLGWSRESRL